MPLKIVFFFSYRKQNEKLLIVLSYAIIDPRTVMVHFFDAPFAHAAMMRPQRFDAQAARTPVNYLPRVFAFFFDVFGRGIIERHTAWIGEHR